jgi:hypothetical protein
MLAGMLLYVRRAAVLHPMTTTVVDETVAARQLPNTTAPVAQNYGSGSFSSATLTAAEKMGTSANSAQWSLDPKRRDG